MLYLSNPPGLDRRTRRDLLDDLARLNRIRLDELGDPEIATRIGQYELAYRMQTSVSELTDISNEPKSILDLYGSDSKKPGTYAFNALLARRLAERGVRFIQLYHRGWDHHSDLPREIRKRCRETDQPTAALVKDLKQLGMLKDTLIIWGGEFGRTVYCQGRLTPTNYGRDHHPSLLYDLDDGRRNQTRGRLRRDGRLLLQHCPGSGPCARSERNPFALPWHRPHQTDL